MGEPWMGGGSGSGTDLMASWNAQSLTTFDLVAICDTMKIFPCEYERMPKVSVEIPQELLDDLDSHVGDDGKFVNRSDAIRASIRKTLDMLDEIDERHGRVDSAETEGGNTN